MYDSRFSDSETSKRDVPSFIEPRPPLITNPFMRPRPQKGTNLMDLFEEESEQPELLQVYLRLKPCAVTNNLYEVRSGRCLITSLDTTTAGHGRRTQHSVSKMFTFSRIFEDNVNQREIFETVVKDNLKKLPDGHSFTLLTYGASGSGKTYTLMGTVASPGLVPRSLEYVFRVVEAAQCPLFKPSEGGADELNIQQQEYELKSVKKLRQVSAPLREKYRRMSTQLCSDMGFSTMDLSKRTRYYVWVSFVEIYNEAIYDLLAPGERRNASKLLIREDSSGSVYVKGATQAFVRSGEEAYDVMVAGKHNLQVAATGVHAQSSRSHCVFTITLITHTEEGVRLSCVRLCDLAGCERARRTRNTGARMQESRAINSSLHVLERCLNTLRRKQRAAGTALVPYRESKLTRLLGAGLSGARGEAVSMVVTVNPAPEYAQETRHVLQLAAVAKDIQVNNTICTETYPSSLETSRDATADGDLLRLRAENERLHFELIQAQTRSEELSACMEAQQRSTADSMRLMMQEAQEISRQYYEAQLALMREQIEEMKNEYEEKLKELSTPAQDTPSKAPQSKITEIAILQEKLNAERLARARAEEEVQYLRACIEERDAIANEEVVSVNDSENDTSLSDEDENCNTESLEPTFTKEDINRSRLIRQSMLIEQEISQDEKSDKSSLKSDQDTSSDTIKDNEEIISSSVTCAERNVSYLSNKIDKPAMAMKHLSQANSLGSSTDDNSEMKNIYSNKHGKISDFDEGVEISNDSSIKDTDDYPDKTYFEREIEMKPVKNLQDMKPICRDTYFVLEPTIQKEHGNVSDDNEIIPKEEDNIRKTNVISNRNNELNDSILRDKCTENKNSAKNVTPETNSDMNDGNITIQNQYTEVVINQIEKPHKSSETFVNNIINAIKTKPTCDNSLRQFEQLEKAVKDSSSLYKIEPREEFCNIKIFKEKRTYFDNDTKETQIRNSQSGQKKSYCYDITADVAADKRLNEDANEIRLLCDVRSPSIIESDTSKDYEPTTVKKLLRESMKRQAEPSTVTTNKNVLHSKFDSFDLFESPQVTAEANLQAENIELLRKSIQKNVHINNERTENFKPAIITEQSSLENILKCDSKPDAPSEKEKPVFKSPKRLNPMSVYVDSSNVSTCKYDDNTVEEFENIYKDITTPRATDFELLMSHNETASQSEASLQLSTTEKVKYNLRHKNDKLQKTISDDDKPSTSKNNDIELSKSHAKSENKTTKKRNLRLRRHKEAKNERNEIEEIDRCNKLKDIGNLQVEFSDVTIDVPAAIKESKDIPSPEKLDNEDGNIEPAMGMQSCPSKSITRSRRKLFTPRDEPLDDSANAESGDRVRAPRPSYHRPRARRKL